MDRGHCGAAVVWTTSCLRTSCEVLYGRACVLEIRSIEVAELLERRGLARSQPTLALVRP